MNWYDYTPLLIFVIVIALYPHSSKKRDKYLKKTRVLSDEELDKIIREKIDSLTVV